MGQLLRLGGSRSGVQFVTSKYALDETLRTMMDPKWPPKATLTTLMHIGNLLFVDALYIHLDDVPIPEDGSADGLCEDPEDIPIILAAVAAKCDVLLTTDKKVLKSRSPVRCLRPDELASEIGDLLWAAADTLAPQEAATAQETPSTQSDETE